MNDDLVVQKISKLLENNTSFIGYALNGGVGTKINVRNTETGKTIQALSINVDSVGEVLVVKDSADGQYKAVTFKVAEKVSEKIIQIRKTKPTDDKKIIDYTEAEIEVFYLFVKLIDMGSPVATQLTSTWIRKNNSCTQFVGAYERCNYAASKVIEGISYKGLPYKPHTSLQSCLNDDSGPDARSPNGSKGDNGGGGTWKIYHTPLDSIRETRILEALTSHDNYYGTSYKNLFGYGSIIECSGGIYLKGWGTVVDRNGISFVECYFGYIPEYMSGCDSRRQDLGHCTPFGWINSKAPTFLEGSSSIDNTLSYQNGWNVLPYDFFYTRSFFTSEYNNSGGIFFILDVNDDQTPSIPSGYSIFVPYCPSAGNGGPYDGSGGNRLPDILPPVEKRTMNLSTHKAEIWLGSSKKTEAIKLYELGASDLFSGSYNAFITKAEETVVDDFTRRNLTTSITIDNTLQHESFYLNRDKNIIDLRIDPRVWVYVLNNEPRALNQNGYHYRSDPQNQSLQILIDNLYNRTINLTVIDKNNLVIHLKLGLTPSNVLSNLNCKGKMDSFGYYNPDSDTMISQSWEYQKYVTIKVKDWGIISTSNTLDVSNLGAGVWNKPYIERKFLTSFGGFLRGNSISYFGRDSREAANNLILRPDNNTSIDNLLAGNNFEQYNYSVSNIPKASNYYTPPYYNSSIYIRDRVIVSDPYRSVGKSTSSWWALWDKTQYNSTTERLSSITGFSKNMAQMATGYKLAPNLNISSTGRYAFIGALGFEPYFEYLPERPLVIFPSNIKSVRDKRISSDQALLIYPGLYSREKALNSYGLNFYFSDKITSWVNMESFSNEAAAIINYQPFPPQYNALYSSQTRESALDSSNFNNRTETTQRGLSARLNTRYWFNNLWAQFIFMGTITVDVDSYKKVKYTLPTNPSQYIKYANYIDYTNSEYSFATVNGPSQITSTSVQSVLSAGILDVTKQVKITKPTNVEIDPNMSFLVYMIPFVSVIKKKKEI